MRASHDALQQENAELQQQLESVRGEAAVQPLGESAAQPAATTQQVRRLEQELARERLELKQVTWPGSTHVISDASSPGADLDLNLHRNMLQYGHVLP
jgi:hypothetical protein